MNRVLLIGGRGFIGSHLVDAFNRHKNNQMYVLDSANRSENRSEKKYIGDVRNSSFLKECILDSKPDLIYYLISKFNMHTVEDFAHALEESAIILYNLFSSLTPGMRLVYTGSSAQYGDVEKSLQPVKEDTPFSPVSNYGVYKVFEEVAVKRLAKKFNIDVVVARIFNITGPYEPTRMVGGSFVSQLSNGNILEVGNLFPKRDFLDVRDVSSALMLIGFKGKSGDVYNVCSGHSISIGEYLDLIIKELSLKPKIKVSQKKINPNEIIDLVGDNTKLSEHLGWKRNYELKETIKDLVASYRSI
jgi:GDP-4-dehydro-6-deoxy-D-mannose reductase